MRLRSVSQLLWLWWSSSDSAPSLGTLMCLGLSSALKIQKKKKKKKKYKGPWGRKETSIEKTQNK